jgi:hypothetical protein
MPKPYHTPKSDRDEALGALAEAEARLERIYGLARHAIAADPRDFEETWMLVEQIADNPRRIRCGHCGENDKSKGSHGLGRCVSLW